MVVAFVVWYVRKSDSSENQNQVIAGRTMGTTYKIIYCGSENETLGNSIDSLLRVFNSSLSTYDPNSEISIFNTHDSLTFSLPYFLPVLEKSREIVLLTEGAFDPTVMPLVRIWGFGPDDLMLPDSVVVDSVMNYVGFEKIDFTKNYVRKKENGVQLDFSAIAKGYAVDIVSEFISGKGYQNYFVEIGGEVVVKGLNKEKSLPWKIGITDPESDKLDVRLFGTLIIKDKAIATSGNYFNYYTVEGKKYSHTLNPKTGYPVRREILSASVITNNCMTADALATAFMVIGYEKAISIIESEPELEGIILYSGKNGKIEHYVSRGLLKDFEKI